MTNSPNHTEDVRSAVQNSIMDALSDNGYMTTRWTVVAEVIENDTGERAVWVLAGEDSRAWDTLGLLQYATQIENAAIVANRLGDHE